jgi:hypothetical protein
MTGAYVRRWLTWGALVMDWPPDVTRHQRIGDLHVVLDALVERMGRTRR